MVKNVFNLKSLEINYLKSSMTRWESRVWRRFCSRRWGWCRGTPCWWWPGGRSIRCWHTFRTAGVRLQTPPDTRRRGRTSRTSHCGLEKKVEPSLKVLDLLNFSFGTGWVLVVGAIVHSIARHKTNFADFSKFISRTFHVSHYS